MLLLFCLCDKLNVPFQLKKMKTRAGGVVQMVECLCKMDEANMKPMPDLPALYKPGMLALEILSGRAQAGGAGDCR